MRHGLTIGELARFFSRSSGLSVDLTVVPMHGWRRNLRYSQLDRVWIPPSPNMPTPQTAAVYPGQVLLEGTNLSEGRGTSVPFEVAGAPFIDPLDFCRRLSDLQLPAVHFLPIWFTPTFDKWAWQSCGGVSIHVSDWQRVRPFMMTTQMLHTCRELYPQDFRWLDPPWEYELILPPIDIISGSDILRTALTSGKLPVRAESEPDPSAWWPQVADILLYKASID